MNASDLPEAFLNRMRATLGDEFGEFVNSYDNPPARAIRVNTLKISPQEFEALSPFALKPVPWCKEGFYIEEEKPGLYIEHAAGLYYVQEPSAMCAAPLLGDLKGGKTVLDMCSAPGGKGTQLAQAMGGEGVLFLNEINFPRAKILSQNVERMGIKNAVVTVASPAQLAEKYPACFDKILVDAPCSGEGMFKKEAAAIAEWSEENVEMCARRQAEILDCADRLLKAGGELVYSTCTFSEAEDERTIEKFLAEHKNYSLETQKKLYPHKVRGEGHFAALLKKNDGEEKSLPSAPEKKLGAREKIYRAFERDWLSVKFENLYLAGDTLYSLPEGAPAPTLQTLRAGVRLGEFVKERFEPSHSLAMCLKRGEASFAELDEADAKNYINGLTFGSQLSGWAVASYKGYPLGWCKVSGGTAKNHYPKGLRICL